MPRAKFHGSFGYTPNILTPLLEPLHPSQHALMELFHANIDEAMLREISLADRGDNADEAFVMLESLLKTGLPPADDPVLCEVLDLTRWGTESDGMRGTWIQLFACAGLVQLAAAGSEIIYSEFATLARFLSCAIDLGDTVARAAASLLAWRALTSPGQDEDPVFLAFAILLLAAHLERSPQRGTWLKQLGGWVIDEEFHLTMRKERDLDTHYWLMGLTCFTQNVRLWRHWTRRILLEPASPHPEEADRMLREIGYLLLGAAPAAGARQ